MKQSVNSPTGSILCVRWWIAPNDIQIKGTVQICHGMAEHSGRYDRFARALNQAGYHCVAHDHRGHGETELNAPAESVTGSLGANGGLKLAADDIGFVSSLIGDKYPGKQILLGHSMGAILALYFSCQSKAESHDAVAFWNSIFDDGFDLKIYRLILAVEGTLFGWQSPSRIAPKLTFRKWNREFAPNRTDYDWLSRDTAEVDKYVQDPKCGFPSTTQLWYDVSKAVKFCGTDSSLDRLPKTLPVNLLGGQADPCSKYGSAMLKLCHRMKTAGMSDVVCQIKPEARHETLNELNRDEATQEFIDWLDQRFGKDLGNH